jgi:protein-tyrosine phosphatase
MTSDDSIAVATQRVIALTGGRNFRELGGYLTREGLAIKWGIIFRSGSLAKLTTADWASLQNRRIRVIVDLRSSAERERDPFALPEGHNINYVAPNTESSFGDLRKVMASNLSTSEAARSAMIAGFREMPYTQAAAYRILFQYLVDNTTPLIFNCSAGKDRAGTAAALVLSALGIPLQTVIEDFVLTDTVGKLQSDLVDSQRTDSLISKQPAPVANVILSAHKDYISAAIESIESRHGSVEEYLYDVIGLDKEALRKLKNNLLN